MKIARLFQNGKSQAVRLPKEFRFEGDFVYVKKSGKGVVLLPSLDSWDTLAASLAKFSEDYMAERNEPPSQKREELG